MPARPPMTAATAKVMADALGAIQQADVDKQFLEVIGYPPAEEAVERLNHYKAVITAGIAFQRSIVEGTA